MKLTECLCISFPNTGSQGMFLLTVINMRVKAESNTLEMLSSSSYSLVVSNIINTRTFGLLQYEWVILV